MTQYATSHKWKLEAYNIIYPYNMNLCKDCNVTNHHYH